MKDEAIIRGLLKAIEEALGAGDPEWRDLLNGAIHEAKHSQWLAGAEKAIQAADRRIQQNDLD